MKSISLIAMTLAVCAGYSTRASAQPASDPFLPDRYSQAPSPTGRMGNPYGSVSDSDIPGVAFTPPASNRDQSEKRLVERIEHLTTAAAHLRQAGFEREADELGHRVRELHQELLLRKSASPNDLLALELRELRRTVEELRTEVVHLRRELATRSGDPSLSHPDPRQLQDEIVQQARERLEKRRRELEEKGRQLRQPEGRAQVPPRKTFTDEELDAVPVDEPMTNESPAQRAPSSRKEAPGGEMEFQLVPVPDIDQTPAKKGDPSPTPVPTPTPGPVTK